jgi:hypothetical protein
LKAEAPKIMLCILLATVQLTSFNSTKSAFLTKHYPGEQFKNNAMGRECGWDEGYEMFIQDLGRDK